MGSGLLITAITFCPEFVSKLLDAGADENGTQAIHVAGRYANDPNIIQLLLDAGADVNALDTDGYTPLHWAATYNKNPEVCRELLIAGAYPNQRDIEGCTALSRALRSGRKSVVRHLLEYGADLRAMSRNVVAPIELNFAESVPQDTRTEISELIIKATRTPERQAQVQTSKNPFIFT